MTDDERRKIMTDEEVDAINRLAPSEREVFVRLARTKTALRNAEEELKRAERNLESAQRFADEAKKAYVNAANAVLTFAGVNVSHSEAAACTGHLVHDEFAACPVHDSSRPLATTGVVVADPPKVTP